MNDTTGLILTQAPRRTGKSRSSSLSMLGAMATGAQVLWASPGHTYLTPHSSLITSSLTFEEARTIQTILESSVVTATTRELDELKEKMEMLAIAFTSLEEDIAELVDAFAALALAILDELEQDSVNMARAGLMISEPWQTIPEEKDYSSTDVAMIAAGRF